MSFITSYRYGSNMVQGYGFSKNTGNDFPYPYDGVKPLRVLDSNDQPRSLLLCREDAKIYWMDTRDGPPGTGISKVWQDKCDTDGANGTDIAPMVKFREDRGSREHFYIEHLKTYLSLRPESESDGYPSGLEVDLDIYKDGEPTTATASTDDIDTDGEIVYDRRVIAHRIQTKVTLNKAKVALLARWHDYVAKDETSPPANFKPTEATYQGNLSTSLVTWISRGSNLLLDRATGNTLSGAGSATAGPDGKSNSALTISSAVNLANAAQASGTLLLWHKPGYTISGVSLTGVSNNGTWYLSYGTNIPANVELGVGDVFDVRIFSGSVDSDTRTYAYNDVINNSGKATLPVW